jgi:hypothetical protein
MAGLVPTIHVLVYGNSKDVDARHKAGHDEITTLSWCVIPGSCAPE